MLAQFINAIVAAVVLIIVISLLAAGPVMLLWNYCLVGAIAGVSEIGFLQALGILVLCSLLFKSSTSSK